MLKKDILKFFVRLVVLEKNRDKEIENVRILLFISVFFFQNN